MRNSDLLSYSIVRYYLFLASVFASIFCDAQNNYWTNQYSAYATLTGGAVMSCSNDNSIFYSNPGAIGFIDSASFSISSNLYAVSLIRLKNAAGPKLDLVSNKFDISAQAMVGNITFKKVPKLHLMYGYIVRNFSRFEFEQQNVMHYDVIPQSAGLEYYRAKFNFIYTFSEYWGGVAAGYQVSKNVSVGLAHFGGYSGVKDLLFQESSVDAITPAGNAYTAYSRGRFKYSLNHVYLLFKPGIDVHFGKFKIGLAAMLPSIQFWGQGKIYHSIELENINYYFPDTNNVLAKTTNFALVGDQKKLKVQYKLPPSISIGFEYGNENFRIALCAEYFFGLKEYELIRGTDNVYARPTLTYGNAPVPDFMVVRTGAYQVLNVGIGIDKKVSQKISILAGFRTDFNNKVPLFRKDYKDYVGIVDPEYWNYLHYSLGVSINKAARRVFVGITYKQGFSNYHKSFTNFTEPSLDNFLVGPQRYDMVASTHAVGLVIGYTNFNAGGSPFKIKKKKSHSTD